MDFLYTRHQVARGSRPDSKSGDTWYLFKHVDALRLTYQIRLLTFAAQQSGCRLVVRTPVGSKVSMSLQEFVRSNKSTIRIDQVP
jgi:hypothetical protein